MSRERKFQITIHLPTALRRAFEAGARATSMSVNQYAALMATEGVEGRTEDSKAIANMSDRLTEVHEMMTAYGAQVSALAKSVAALAEGVERLAERVVALKHGVTGGAVQVIDTPASVNGGTGGAIR